MLEPCWGLEALLRVVDDRENRLAIGVPWVAPPIDKELFANLECRETWASRELDEMTWVMPIRVFGGMILRRLF